MYSTFLCPGTADRAAAPLQRHALARWGVALGREVPDGDRPPGEHTSPHPDLKRSSLVLSKCSFLTLSGGRRWVTSQSDRAFLWGAVESEQTLPGSAVPVAKRNTAGSRIPFCSGLCGTETHLQPAAPTVKIHPSFPPLQWCSIRNKQTKMNRLLWTCKEQKIVTKLLFF